jgi:ubiquinone/menaquinone biosynthesis C-methylase UbiE
MLTPTEIARVYAKRAAWYDVTAVIYVLTGFRGAAYRRMAVRALCLRQGETVVEIGCGTGVNFPLLLEAVGPRGRLIGVDMTPEMLAQARKRVERRGWKNVDLVTSRASEYEFPAGISGVISTFALTLEPQYDAVIRRAASALRPAGRFVVLDFKLPDGWPRWLTRFWSWILSPFGVTLDLSERHPWESVARYLSSYRFRTVYSGLAYVAAGTRDGRPAVDSSDMSVRQGLAVSVTEWKEDERCHPCCG